MKKPWFHAKKYGFGWGLPATWQGWVVLLGYIIIVLYDFFRIDDHSHSASDTLRPFFIQLILITLVLVAIMYLTGEKPKWRWKNKR